MSRVCAAMVPVRNPKLAWREMDGEIVIISPEDSSLHELNETASVIWKYADGARDVGEIAARVAGDYDVPLHEAQADAAELIALLVRHNLLAINQAGEVL